MDFAPRFLTLVPFEPSLSAQSIAFSASDEETLFLGGTRHSYHHRTEVPHHTADFIFQSARVDPDHATIRHSEGILWLSSNTKENPVRIHTRVLEPNETVQLGDGDHIDLGQQNDYSGNFEAVITLRVQLSSKPPPGHSFVIASATVCDNLTALVTTEEQLREELALVRQRLQTALTSFPAGTLPPPARPYADLVQDLRLKSGPHSTVQCWCCSAPVVVPRSLPATSPTSGLTSVLGHSTSPPSEPCHHSSASSIPDRADAHTVIVDTEHSSRETTTRTAKTDLQPDVRATSPAPTNPLVASAESSGSFSTVSVDLALSRVRDAWKDARRCLLASTLPAVPIADASQSSAHRNARYQASLVTTMARVNSALCFARRDRHRFSTGSIHKKTPSSPSSSAASVALAISSPNAFSLHAIESGSAQNPFSTQYSLPSLAISPIGTHPFCAPIAAFTRHLIDIATSRPFIIPTAWFQHPLFGFPQSCGMVPHRLPPL